MLCALPSSSLPGFFVSLETICEATLSCTYLHWGQTPRVSSLSAAFASLAGCQLDGPGKSSSRAGICLEMLGICLNTTFHQTFGFFLGLWGAAFTAPVDPHSAAFYFLPLPCKGRPPGPPGLWICCLCSHEAITEPLISAHSSPHCTMAAILGVYRHPFCSPEKQHITDPNSGEQCGMLQIAGFSLCFLCLRRILDSNEISASLPITVSRAKISPHGGK